MRGVRSNKACSFSEVGLLYSQESSLYMYLGFYRWSYIYISAGHLTLEIDMCDVFSRSVVCFFCAFKK